MPVARIEPAQRQRQLVQHAHRKGAGTDRRIEYPQRRYRPHDRALFPGLEQLPGVRVVEQITQPLAPELLVPVRRRGALGQRGRQRLVHHVVHDVARRVVGAGQLARSVARFRVVGGQQIFKYPAQQLRVERHVLIERRVLLHRELVAAEQREQPVLGVEEQRRRHVQIAALRGDVVGKGVDAAAAGAARLVVVQAVEQAAVDERHRVEQA